MECLAPEISSIGISTILFKDLLPIPKEYTYARQIESYARIGDIIEAKRSIGVSMSVIDAEILIHASKSPQRIQIIARRALRLMETLQRPRSFKTLTP